ncbi:PREDICTED: multiple epidermal growth factor-like domains protein 9 [Amphimedon queenslandica]|uniref:Laminin G domain-containing protein n=1 Tax=Amphimedon queenslandica TaxID=400682 RepID=A0A1X7TGZ6_AMPQE|nr:PREDICTED: multiple epidermal growth factor-like domains protein 9 [Amphimedon queenslandica]|eukprot:XP_003390606.1 PREDICTED: multiple epidermal growth factor-like domains protein 9 [Amphimedon queenslandica]
MDTSNIVSTITDSVTVSGTIIVPTQSVSTPSTSVLPTVTTEISTNKSDNIVVPTSFSVTSSTTTRSLLSSVSKGFSSLSIISLSVESFTLSHFPSDMIPSIPNTPTLTATISPTEIFMASTEIYITPAIISSVLSHSSVSSLFTPEVTATPILPCDCNFNGTLESGSCNATLDKKCICKHNVVGELCDECADGFFGLQLMGSCEACSCCLDGTLSCNKLNGSCTCNEGYGGPQCCQKLERQGWKFNGSSYLQYRTQFRRTIRKMVIDVTFKPSSLFGLIMFASRWQNGTGSYFYIQLNNTLQFSMNIGNSVVLLSSQMSNIELEKWQSLRIVYYAYNHYVTMELNKRLVSFTTFFSTLSGLRLSSGSLYIGKTSPIVVSSPASLVKSGFKGCIDQININVNGYYTVEAITEAVNIKNCYKS